MLPEGELSAALQYVRQRVQGVHTGVPAKEASNRTTGQELTRGVPCLWPASLHGLDCISAPQVPPSQYQMCGKLGGATLPRTGDRVRLRASQYRVHEHVV